MFFLIFVIEEKNHFSITGYTNILQNKLNMANSFREAMKHRRSYYSLTNSSLISDKEIQEIIEFVVSNAPSAFNSQSTRVVLLLGDHHKKLWDIVKGVLKAKISADAFQKTEAKIDGSFASGYGTVLFFEDQSVVEGLQKAFPSYSDNFPGWSVQTSAIHQFSVWSLLEDAGFGASLQHYNPIIDDEVAKEWNVSKNWKLIAQMPFGVPTDKPGEKEVSPLKDRILVFK